uniref:MULE transposase domain-containing protein n=1 Tax=Plectus sambesii TaxID=2011161 RepID=A0A914V4C5_9BILA
MEVVSAQLDMHRNHIADSSKLDVLEAMRALKLRAVETQQATSTIVASARHHTSTVATAHLPLADSLRHNVCRYRVAALGEAALGDIQTLVIPQRFKCYQQKDVVTGHGYTEQRFLQFDTNKAEYDKNGERLHGNPRILVLGTNNSLKALQESQDWFCDGTFDVTPKGFSQYYTIHCRLDKGELGVYTLPCLFIFMSNRQTVTYVRLFIALCYYAGLTPRYCMTDFEEAAINAFNEVWPDIHVSGCFFHLTQNQQKKLAQSVCGSTSLSLVVTATPALQQQVKMVWAMAFIPLDDLEDVWDQLVATLDQQLRPLFEYFDEYYMGKRQLAGTHTLPRFAWAIWNMFERTRDGLPRTNNSVEAFHKSLNTHFAVNHPNT